MPPRGALGRDAGRLRARDKDEDRYLEAGRGIIRYNQIMKTMKTTVIVLAVVIVVLLGILAFYNPAQGPTKVAQKEAVSSDGHMVVAAPLPNDLITAPVTVNGTVIGGGWFFEASFPVKVLDGDGTTLGQGTARAGGAPGSWMSTGTVPFTATITFTTPKGATGTLVLKKDNPSGDPANDLQLSIPIRFK
jgi:hypothetical protein